MGTHQYKLLALLLLGFSLSGCKSTNTGTAVDRASFKCGDSFSRTLCTISGNRASKWELTHNEEHKKRVVERRLPCLLRSILGGGHSGAVFELFGEAAGIDEASFAGDLGGGEAGFLEEGHGGRTRVLMWNSWGLNL